jgi:hypothetical protein
MDRNKKLKHPLKDSFGNVAKLTKINDMQKRSFHTSNVNNYDFTILK